MAVDGIELARQYLVRLQTLGDYLPVLVGALIGAFATLAGAAVTGLITAKVQAQQLAYEESVRIDQVRRDLVGRFDQVRREVYARFVGTAMSVSADAAELLSMGDPKAAADSRRRLYTVHTEAMRVHGEVTILATSRIVECAHAVMAVLTRLTFGSIALRLTWQPSSAEEKLPQEFQKWAEELDAARQEFVAAVRSELRIVELLNDPIIDGDRAAEQTS